MPQPQPQNQNTPQKRPQHYAQATRRRRQNKKKKQVIAFLVMLVLVVLLFLVALLVTLGQREEEPEVVPSAAPSQAPAVVASAPPPPVSVSVAPPRTPTPYDEAGMPPLYNYANPLPTMEFVWMDSANDRSSAEAAGADYLDGTKTTGANGAQLTYLLNVGGGQTMELRAALAFLDMQAAAAADGVTLTPVSGYRSNAQQTNNYNASIQRHRDNGLSEAEAIARTQRYYAIPGTSEHEAGLAMDINWVDDGFAQTEAYTWLQEHCTEYGFIYRYRAETEETTHIAWEPWHYRYVGANHAEAIAEAGITLEEYTEQMRLG